jgi:hypothetical protein
VIKGREYARRYREQTIPIIGKYTQRKREFNEIDYDTTLPVLTSEGWVGDDVLKRRRGHARRIGECARARGLRQVLRLQHGQKNLSRAQNHWLEAGALTKQGTIKP